MYECGVDTQGFAFLCAGIINSIVTHFPPDLLLCHQHSQNASRLHLHIMLTSKGVPRRDERKMQNARAALSAAGTFLGRLIEFACLLQLHLPEEVFGAHADQRKLFLRLLRPRKRMSQVQERKRVVF